MLPAIYENTFFFGWVYCQGNISFPKMLIAV